MDKISRQSKIWLGLLLASQAKPSQKQAKASQAKIWLVKASQKQAKPWLAFGLACFWLAFFWLGLDLACFRNDEFGLAWLAFGLWLVIWWESLVTIKRSTIISRDHSSRYYYEISVSRPTANAPKICTKTTPHKSIILYWFLVSA